jgi:hypothetical protein
LRIDEPVPRPLKKSEYKIFFESNKLRKTWIDLLAVRRSDLSDAWDFLTRTPLNVTSLSHPMRDDFQFLIAKGVSHQRWQLKLSATDGSRIWYFVEDQSVYIERIFTAHPNQTKN